MVMVCSGQSIETRYILGTKGYEERNSFTNRGRDVLDSTGSHWSFKERATFF